MAADAHSIELRFPKSGRLEMPTQFGANVLAAIDLFGAAALGTERSYADLASRTFSCLLASKSPTGNSG